MRKITILSLPLLPPSCFYYSQGTQSKAQDRDKIIADIAEQNTRFTEWFNAGSLTPLEWNTWKMRA